VPEYYHQRYPVVLAGERLDTIPFDADYKFMGTMHDIQDSNGTMMEQ
jgi:hypothetical protein